MFVVDAHAEYARDALPAHGRAILLGVFAIGPGSHEPVPALAVGKQRGRKLADGLHIQLAERAAAGVGYVASAGVDGSDLFVPQAPQIEEPLLPPDDVLLSCPILWVVGARQVQAGGRAKILTAVLAVAHAAARPTIGEDAVRHVPAHDLFMHSGHELEVVGTEGACFPVAGIGRMPDRVAVRVHPDPVRVRVINPLPARVRIGPGDDVHAHCAAAGKQVAKGVAGAEPRAALLQRNLRRVKRHHTARAQAGRVGVNAVEVVEPELRIVVAGIVLDKR